MEEVINIVKEDGLKFPFKEKDWMNKFGIFAALTLVPGILLIASIFLIIFPLIGGFLFLAAIVVCTPIFLLLSLYLNGYVLQLIKNVKEEKEDDIPKHENIPHLLKMGVKKLILEAIPMFLSLFFFLITVGVSISGVILITSEMLTIGIIVVIIGAILNILSILIMMFTIILVLPTVIYLYLEKGSIKESYNTENIHLIIKENWKEFLMIYLLSLIGGILLSVLTNLPFVGIIAMYIGIAYIQFVVSFTTGKIYLNIKTKIN